MSRTCSATRSPPPSKRAVPTQASRSRSNATAHSLLCTGRPHLRAAPCVFCARNIWPRSLCLPGRGTHGWRLRRARAAFRSLLQTLAANAPRAGLVPEQTSCAGRRRHHLARYLGAARRLAPPHRWRPAVAAASTRVHPSRPRETPTAATFTSAPRRDQDTAGQERFHALGPIYYRDADGAPRSTTHVQRAPRSSNSASRLMQRRTARCGMCTRSLPRRVDEYDVCAT